jgi:hemerythrin-like domain-containing protein
VADVLKDYEIGCVSCGLGTCLLKDIVGIHNLDPKEEADLITRISRVIYPDREVIVSPIERKNKPQASQGGYSPPLKKLVDEHTLIKRWVAMIPRVINYLNLASESDRQLIRQGIDFIQGYADKYHHAKEEDVLFKCFDENLNIIKTMCADHENARSRVRQMLAALDRQDKATLAKQLEAYHDLLTEHIQKEDEILYHWMDRNLSITQIGELFAKFNEKDQEFGDKPKKYAEFVKQIEAKF